jgi:inosose dehydratase
MTVGQVPPDDGNEREQMKIRIANAPVSFGVDYADDPGNPAWQEVLDGIAAAGYEWMELGPVGYLPEDPALLAEELSRRSLRITGTFVFDFLHDPAQRSRVLEVTARACRLIAATGGRNLVVIDHLSPERIAVAGRPADRVPLEGAAFDDLLAGLRAVAGVANELGIRPVLHPHAGTFVEYRDEIDRVLESLGPDEVGLCIDTGHSAYAGVDPVALYRDHADRTEYFHFKDIDEAVHARALETGLDFEQAVTAGVFCPLGSGVVDFAGLRAALDEHGFDGVATVEQDRDPAVPADPIRDAVESLEFLRGVGLAPAAGKSAEAGRA